MKNRIITVYNINQKRFCNALIKVYMRVLLFIQTRIVMMEKVITMEPIKILYVKLSKVVKKHLGLEICHNKTIRWGLVLSLMH